MKKLFFLLSFLFVTLNSVADNLTKVYSIDYQTTTSFPFYVMDYTPEFDADNGLISKFPGAWYQYFAGDLIPTEAGKTYIVECEIRSEEATTIPVNMGWGWGDGEILNGSMTISTEWEKQTAMFINVGGNSCNVIFQPGMFASTFYIRNLTVYCDESAGKPTEPKVTELISNNDCEGSDVSSFTVKESEGELVNRIDQGVGVDGSRGIQVLSKAGAAQDWDTQFWINLPQDNWLQAGQTFTVSFDYKASNNVTVDTQAHATPGNYQHWECIGAISFTTDWQTYTKTVTVDANMAGEKGLGSIAFNLSKDRNNDIYFYFDNIYLQAQPAPVVETPKEPEIPESWEFVEQGDPNFHIYLCFGQSNMEGNAQPEAVDKENVPERFKMMAAVNFNSPKRTMGEWYTAVPPLCRQGNGLTPADYFGRTLVEKLPEEISVGVINVAVGGAKIELFMEEFKDSYIAGEADWFKNYCKQYDNDPFGRLIEMAKIAQKSGTIKGILLHQGESNNGQADWAQKVAKVYTRICYNLGLDPAKTPLLAGETVYANKGGVCSLHNTNSLPKLKNAIPNSYVISADGLSAQSDGLHFTAQGYREFGVRYAEKMLELLGADGIDNIVAAPAATIAFDLFGNAAGADAKGLIVKDGAKLYVK